MIAETLRIKEAAQTAVAKDQSLEHFLADEMLRKDLKTEAKGLADAATEAYQAAMSERDAFDRDIEHLAMAAFKLMQKKPEFVKNMQEKYFNQSPTYVANAAQAAWTAAAKKIQEELQDELKEAEADQMQKTAWRKEAGVAQASGMTQDQWKASKLAGVVGPVEQALNAQLADEAWIAAIREKQALQDAMDAIERGRTQDDFERDETSKKDPSDERNLAQQLADAAAAWAEAAKQIAAKVAEDS